MAFSLAGTAGSNQDQRLSSPLHEQAQMVRPVVRPVMYRRERSRTEPIRVVLILHALNGVDTAPCRSTAPGRRRSICSGSCSAFEGPLLAGALTR